ncbi:MAG: type IV secretory system conjugative DNA transfer family protein [Verrucomicrobiota bacterium]
MMRLLQQWLNPPVIMRPPVHDELDHALLTFGNESLTLRACCEGIFITGATGSGKTSGSGAALAKSFLRNGFGGIVTCCKPDEAEVWRRYARETGRERDLIFFGPRHPHRFNYLSFAAHLTPNDISPTENLTQLLGTVIEVANRGQATTSQDPYWSRAALQLLRNSTDLVLLARGVTGLTLHEIYQAIITAPTDAEQLQSREWQRSSRCMQLLDEAHRRRQPIAAAHDLSMTSNFWLKEFPNLSPRTRGCVISMVTTGIEPLLRGSAHELTNTTTTVTPLATHQGKIIVLDMPAKTYHSAGILIQLIIKQLWQQATEGRRIHRNSLPTFCFSDEAQTFVSRNDSNFLMTARSSRACVVLLTQNLPNFRAALGKAETSALIGNLVTRIHHQNVCSETNAWASESISKCWRLRTSSGTSHTDDSEGHERLSHSSNLSDSHELRVPPEAFLHLRRGGPGHDRCVDAIISRPWSTGRGFLRATFRQS